MAVTNLTNTVWLFNSTINISTFSFSIRFNVGDGSYNELVGDGPESSLYYNDSKVYDGTWTHEVNRTIIIKGGFDADNPTLIAWLEANATQKILAHKLLYKESDEVVSKYAEKDIHGRDIAEGSCNYLNASDIDQTGGIITLTQAQYNLIINGKITRITGVLDVYTDILITRTLERVNDVRCMFEGKNNGTNNLYKGALIITKATLVLTYVSPANLNLELGSIETLNNKSINYYLNNVYPYASNATTELKYETINNISISTDTTFTLATAPANTYPEYKANITNSGANAITLTFTGVSKAKCNDSNIVITEGTNTTVVIPDDTTIEINIQNGLMIVFNWAVSN